MNFIENEILSGEIVPVLLGASPEGNRTARRLFGRYHVLSHLFCESVPFSARLTCCMKFHVIRHTSGDSLMLTALLDFARQLGQADLILYLIPCTPDYANFVWRNRAALECNYVIADQPEMEKVWFGDEIDGKEANES